MARLDFASALRKRGSLAAAFAAATDDPNLVVARAFDRAVNAPRRERQNLTIREAAELAWLAATAAVDRAAIAVGEKAPHGFESRVKALKAYEKFAATHGRLNEDFQDFYHTLHGGCFYGDRCPDRAYVLAKIEAVQDFVAIIEVRTPRAVRAARKRKR